MNELTQLAADLAWAAKVGSDKAGHAAVQAGMHHADNAARALVNVEHVTSQFTGSLGATVTASQPAAETSVGAITAGGPSLPPSEGIAARMAEVAAAEGQSAISGKHH